MRVNVKTLTPGVQHRQKTDGGSQVLEVCRDGQESFGSRAEEDAVEFFRILGRQASDLLW